MTQISNRQLLKHVASKLEELVDQVYFVGGAINDIYVTREVSEPSRGTVDVDFVIKAVGYGDYASFGEKLRAKGFHEDHESNVICRWKVDNVTVDVMPTDKEIIGFANQWYDKGIEKSQTFRLDDNLSIQVFQPAYYLATKIEALFDRGGDWRYSKDFEDIIFLFRSRAELADEINSAIEEVKAFIHEGLKTIIEHNNIRECIYCQFTDPDEAEQFPEIILEEWNSVLAD